MRAVCVGLVIAIFSAFGLSNVEAKERTEDVSKRTMNSKTFRNQDGSYTLQEHFGNIHYFDGKKYQDIVPIPFPDGKEINSNADLDMIDIPSWATAEILPDGS
jgi:hypothetical protein